MTTSMRQALDELYASSPDTFTQRRDEIVKELKAAGNKDAAVELAKRRKPTQVAYILNQLARKYPDDVAEFVDVGRELERAHRKALRGDKSANLADAMNAQRSAVQRLGSRVGDVMRELQIDAEGVVDKVTAALQAALVDAAAAAQLEEGLLEKAPEIAGTFGIEEEAPIERVARVEPAHPARRAPSTRETRIAARKAAIEERRRKREQEREQKREEERRAKTRERDEERVREEGARAQLAQLEEQAQTAAAVAKERADTAKLLTDEAERLMDDARMLAEQAEIARDEAKSAQHAAEAAQTRLREAKRAAKPKRRVRRRA